MRRDIAIGFVVASIFLTLINFAPVNSFSQDSTFTVTVEEKTEAHPHTNEGWGTAYAINGKQDPDLVLQRGNTYEFHMENISSAHPFYLSQSEMGLGIKVYSEGVQNNNATDHDTLVFTPSNETPDSLYYQCQNHSYMGNVIRIEGENMHLEDESRQPRALNLDGNYPNPFNPGTTLYFDLQSTARVMVRVYDISGRKVMNVPQQTVTAGKNRTIRINADGLSSGMYLYRVTAKSKLKTWERWGKMTLLK